MLTILALVFVAPLGPHQSAAAHCIDIPLAKNSLETDVEISVSIVEPGVDDSIEVRQVGCRSAIPIIVYGDGRALADLVDLQARRSGKVAHARMKGRIEIPSFPPDYVGPPYVNFRMQNISETWLEAATQYGS
jgi:hypothetical protein